MSTVPDCVSNLSVCNSMCCKLLYFDFKFLSSVLHDYYLTRGCRVLRLPDRSYRILVPHVCRYLNSESGLCMLHSSGSKPFPCLDFNRKSRHKYYIPEGCVYE